MQTTVPLRHLKNSLLKLTWKFTIFNKNCSFLYCSHTRTQFIDEKETVFPNNQLAHETHRITFMRPFQLYLFILYYCLSKKVYANKKFVVINMAVKIWWILIWKLGPVEGYTLLFCCFGIRIRHCCEISILTLSGNSQKCETHF